MKTYDFAKAQKFIEDNISSINRASLGMDEDWFWTAETIFENGSFTKNLKSSKVDIGGINASTWATPTLEIEYKDGSIKKYNCYIGESDGPRCPEFMYGCISGRIAAERSAEERLDIE
jgi:hypothetical protein